MKKIILITTILMGLIACKENSNQNDCHSSYEIEEDTNHTDHLETVSQDSTATVIDPVCKMTIPKTGDITTSHKGTTYHFCSEMCVTRFNDNPLEFLEN